MSNTGSGYEWVVWTLLGGVLVVTPFAWYFFLTMFWAIAQAFRPPKGPPPTARRR
jgi:hypothetical protein